MRAGAAWRILLWASLIAPANLEAQAVVPESGEEVRVVQRGARGAVHGLYVEATAGDILLQSIRGGGPIRIQRSAITGMSVQRGQRSQAWAGALIGIGVGLVGGVVLAQTTDVFGGTGVAVGASAGAALPLGLLVGWLVKSPEWDGVDMGALGVRPSLEWR